MASLKIALLSDLHFFVKDSSLAPATSHLPLDSNGEIVKQNQGTNKNPWDDLIELVKKERLQCDVVLCPGDITTRADHRALKTGWRKLLELGDCLGATWVCAATGNHDVASRSNADIVGKNPARNWGSAAGAVEALKLLDPLYPVARKDVETGEWMGLRATQSHYFGESFVNVTDQDKQFHLLILNSCSEHGHDAFEYERGTAPESTLRWIRQDAPTIEEDCIKLLMVHHPLFSTTDHDSQGYDFVLRGDALLKMLEKRGQWLVLHGHKHQGVIGLAPTQNDDASVVLSAASFGAAMEDNGAEDCENQFYILDVEKPAGFPVRGTVKAWSWSYGVSWRRSPPGKGERIYFDCGFGATKRADDIAAQIASEYDRGTKRWDDLVKALPDLKHMLPAKLAVVRNKLMDKHQLIIEQEDAGWHVAITRMVTS